MWKKQISLHSLQSAFENGKAARKATKDIPCSWCSYYSCCYWTISTNCSIKFHTWKVWRSLVRTGRNTQVNAGFAMIIIDAHVGKLNNIALLAIRQLRNMDNEDVHAKFYRRKLCLKCSDLKRELNVIINISVCTQRVQWAPSPRCRLLPLPNP